VNSKIVGIKWPAEVRRFLSRLAASYPRPLASCSPLPPPYPPPPTFLPLQPRPRLARTLPATCTHISDVIGLSSCAGTHPLSVSTSAGMFPTVPHAGEVSSVNTPHPGDPHSLGGGNIAHDTPPDGTSPLNMPLAAGTPAGSHAAGASAAQGTTFAPSHELSALLDRIEALEGRWDEAVAARSGLSALRAIVVREARVLGKALAACAVSRLLKKVHARPTRSRPQRSRVGRAGILSVDIDCTRKAMEELICMTKLVSVVTRRKVGGPVSCVVQPSSLSALASALSMTPSDLASAKVCRFTSRTGAVLTRLMLEEMRDESGRVWYILDRHLLTRELTVAVRESEQLSERGADFLYPLEKKRVKAADLIGACERYPAALVWREGLRMGGGSTSSAMEAGTLVLSVPIALLECDGLDAASLLDKFSYGTLAV